MFSSTSFLMSSFLFFVSSFPSFHVSASLGATSQEGHRSAGDESQAESEAMRILHSAMVIGKHVKRYLAQKKMQREKEAELEFLAMKPKTGSFDEGARIDYTKLADEIAVRR